MINAEKAREYTEISRCKCQQEQLLILEDCIRKAAKNGHYETTETVRYLFPENLKLLEDLGYKCDVDKSMPGEDWVTIDWRK